MSKDASSPAAAGLWSRLPVMQGVLPIEGSRVPLDIVAGITLAALAIPEVMGYTSIAGMPVITGLYTILIPIAVFAVLGSSRHLVVGADSATAAILAAGLIGLAATGSPQYVALAGLAAIVTGAILILARLVRLGFLADFLSRSVLIGFLTGVGVQVAMGQLADMLGVPGGTSGGQFDALLKALGLSGTIDKFVVALTRIPKASLPTLAVSIGVLVVIVGARLINRKIPGALIAVIGAIAVSYFAHLAAHGVAVLGTVPGGLPKIGLPSVGVKAVPQVLATCFSMFLVILAQSAATSRAYGARYNERVSEDEDLVGLGLANVTAGLSGTFVVNGSPTKTQMVDSAGGRSQLATLTTAVLVAIVLLFLTGPLAYMPKAVLASVVFLIGIELTDIAGLRRVLRARSIEFWVAAVTAVVVVIVGVEQAILLAIVLSMIAHLRHGYRPKNTLLTRDDDGHLRPRPVDSAAQLAPGLMAYSFSHSAYYANAEQLTEQVLDLVKKADPPLQWFCFDGRSVNDVDYTAGVTLVQLQGELKDRGVRLVMAGISDHVRAELDRDGLVALIGEDGWFDYFADLLEGFQRQAERSPDASGATSTAPTETEE